MPLSSSGAHYFRARHYSTQFGRFMSPDPTGIFLGNLNDPQSLNLYAYVRNNSPSMTDPSGLQCDGFDSDCCDICIPIDIGIGIGGGGDSGRIGPQPPLHIQAGGISPNPSEGTLTSDDPFSGETNGIPNGLQIPIRDLAGMLGIEMPPDFGFGLRSNPSLGSIDKLRQFGNQLSSCLHQTLRENLSEMGRDQKRIALLSVATGAAVAISTAIEFPPLAPAAPEVGIAVGASTEVSLGTARIGVWQMQNVASTIGCTIFTAGHVFF